MNRALRACTYTAGAALALTLGACISPQVGAPCPIPDNATPAQRLAALQNCYGPIGVQYYPAGVQKDVDILFMIDNSTSMSPKQSALANNISEFIKQIEGFGANYHVAVTTSDIGSTIADGQFWNDPTIQVCNSFKGDDGLLQITPCNLRTNVSSDARNVCPNTTCAAFGQSVTNDGARYISSIDGKTNVNGTIADAFKCMALVGDGGCGIEGQFEAAKRALDGHLPENNGFRRSNAVLAVIFVTDEDDCSVQLARRNENSPNTRDCASPDQNASYDCFNYDYRCLARSIQCDQPMNTPGAKTNCHERADNYLEPIKKYHDFFTALANPGKLVVSGIWTLESLDPPGNGTLSVNFSGAGSSTPFLNRAGGLQASCSVNGDPSIFGQAQRRLSALAKSFGDDGSEATICENRPAEVAKNLKAIGERIGKKLGPMCLPVVPKLLAPGQPNCLVGEVDESNKNALPDVLLPACSTTCCAGWANSATPTNQDPGVIAACTAEAKDCFCAVKTTQPDVCSGNDGVGAVGGVWRVGNASPPSGRFLNFRCAGGG